MKALSGWIAGWRCGLAVALLGALPWQCGATSLPHTAAAGLRAQYAAMQTELAQSPFARPLVVRSDDSNGRVRGDVFAVVDFPVAQVIQALDKPAHWCDIMILHINTKYCLANISATGTQISVYIGKKTPENLINATPMVLEYQARTPEADYLNIGLSAKAGPVGTNDYDIVLEAVALSASRTFLHLTYAYNISRLGKLALQTYLATVGRNKLGFSSAQSKTDGKAELTGGVRGVVERNTMRYYLAIQSYLEAEQRPVSERQEARLLGWITATERYPDQLFEMDRDTYLAMKRVELVRQQMPR